MFVLFSLTDEGVSHPLPAQEQTQVFAICAGRLSAVMEHQWMFDGAASERTQRERAALIALLEASMPLDRGREILRWRIDAKIAQAALLSRATFNSDPVDARHAARLAEQRRAECTGFLLS
ncbi:hypothetical protein [Thalassococcus sp. S3]|uniref:hypothetical protein n=1 Tax=Thalassococcus sp. S3 TaxID=2017482 RepID=UPI00102425FC|nr:hypothetical protein [Thalassococcus sp. S3]QBF31266.1 hypothetical protein CFI11_08550 [Thalassococcus sp. S3]